MQTVILRNSRKQYVVFLAIGLVFVAGGLFILLTGDTEAAWIAWLCVLFFGACVAVFLRQLFDNRPRIVMDERGITDRMLGVGLIAWSDIEDAYAASVNRNAFICLELRNTDDYLQRLSPLKQKITKANTALGFTPLSLNLSGVEADPEEVLELILLRIELQREE
ncbi:MAG TPA: STM3941 family protein [Rhodothermales bacterium]|nr:STM3941 family protein [Rhodothermales bacterium]